VPPRQLRRWNLFGPATNEHMQFPLNHYVVLEGEVPQDFLVVLNKWLAEVNARRFTDNIWIHSAIESEDWSKLHVRLLDMPPKTHWKPFRVLFLRPHDNACFSHRMPTASISTDGNIGTWGTSF
jgi:hypothetical protein